MENPKVRIESDGNVTEVYINGEKVKAGTMVDFHFRHDVFEDEPNRVSCTLTQNILDDRYRPVFKDGEIVNQTLKLL
jgi:3'-phosphoadenosine 5'-phosphosulfate sulfotransferase